MNIEKDEFLFDYENMREALITSTLNPEKEVFVAGIGQMYTNTLTVKFINEVSDIMDEYGRRVVELEKELDSIDISSFDCNECTISDTAFEYITKQVKEINCIFAEKVHINGLRFKAEQLKDCISRIETTLEDHEQ